MKKLNKKPLLIIGGIFGVIILIIIIVAVARSCERPGTNYEKVEKLMSDAAAKYFASEGRGLPEEFQSKEVSAAELASNGFMNGLSAYLVDNSCTGKVSVYNHGGQFLYVPHLECAEYKTTHLVDKIIAENLVETTETSASGNESTSGRDYISGLYDMNGTYVFRGKNPHNYLSFGGISWRIIDINADGKIRLIKSESENRSIYWDTKFNSEAGKAYGINDYKNSYILEFMNNSYKSFKNDSKIHLAPFSVCVGKRDSTQLEIDKNIDCAETLENQYIGLISSVDVALASLDENCSKITNGACTNYNYLAAIIGETWTSTSLTRNTYEVVYINGGVAAAMNARRTAYYNLVIAMEGNEKYISGDGTATNPYTVGTLSNK